MMRALVAGARRLDLVLVRDLLILVLLFLSFAAANGFPFYFPDSAEYAGYRVATGGVRPLALAILARPLWPLIGPWAVPVLSSVVLSIVLVRFQRLFLLRTGILALVFIALISVTPFYTGLIMADVWIVIAVLAVLIASRDDNLLFKLVAIFAILTHGGHIYVLLPVALVLVALSVDRRPVATRIGGILAVALCIMVASQLATTYVFHGERLSWATVTSRVLTAVPDLLPVYCAESPNGRLCAARAEIEDVLRNGVDNDGKVIWSFHVHDRDSPVNLTSLNEAGPRLLYLAVTRRPYDFAREIYRDLRKVVTGGCFGLAGRADRDYLVPIQEWEPAATLARSGFFTREDICRVVHLLRYLLYILAAVGGGYALAAGGRTHRLVALTALTAVAANLIFYVTLSGGAPRYHIRALMLVGIIALAGWDAFLQRRALRSSATEQALA